MPILAWILVSTFFISIISLVGAVVLVLKVEKLKKVTYVLVALSAGGMMGGAFFHLLPEALAHLSAMPAFMSLLTGFCVFFLLERFILWRHCHNGVCEIHPFTYLNLIGDGIHNFIDGMVIAAGYLAGVEIGIAATIAILLHEVPQELGDFGVLVFGGFSRAKALLLNFLTALLAVTGAVIGYLLLGPMEKFVPFVLPFAAGGFIYIASADLIPELNKEAKLSNSMTAFTVFILGLVLMAVIKLGGGR